MSIKINLSNKNSSTQAFSQVSPQNTPADEKVTKKTEDYFGTYLPAAVRSPMEYFNATFHTLENFGLRTEEDLECLSVEDLECLDIQFVETLKGKIGELEKLIQSSQLLLQEPNQLQRQIIIPAKEIITSLTQSKTDSSGCFGIKQEQELQETLKNFQEITQGELRHAPAILTTLLSSLNTDLNTHLKKLTSLKLVIKVRDYVHQFNIHGIWQCCHGVGIDDLHSLQRQLKLKRSQLFHLNDLKNKQLESMEPSSEHTTYPSDGKIQVNQFNNLPAEVIQLIYYALMKMQAYDLWTLACVSKDLKAFAEDPVTLNHFLKELSDRMRVSPVDLERALRKIKLPPDFSNNPAVKSPLFHDEQIVKLRLFHLAQIKKIIDAEKAIHARNCLFSERLSPIQLQKMLGPPCLNTLLEAIRQGDLLTALLTLDSMKRLTVSDFKKIIEKLGNYKNRTIFPIMLEVVEKILQQKMTMRSEDLRDISTALLNDGNIAEAEGVANVIPDDDTRKSSTLEKVSEAFLEADNITAAERFANAERVALSIPNNTHKSYALEKVSEAFLKATHITETKRFANAERVALSIPNDLLRSAALEKVSEAFLKATHITEAERFANAERVALSIPNNELKSSALKSILKAKKTEAK